MIYLLENMKNHLHDMDDWGKLILRLGTAVLMGFHGVTKLFTGYDHIGGFLTRSGLPDLLKHGVIVAEVLVPLFLLLGILTRPAAAILVFHMIFAIRLAHGSRVFSMNDHHGWAIELNVLFITLGFGLVLLGGGRFTIEAVVKGQPTERRKMKPVSHLSSRRLCDI